MDPSDTPAGDAAVDAAPRGTGAAYRRRPVRFLHLSEVDGWRAKIYGIAARGEEPRAALVDAAERAAGQHLPRRSPGDSWSGVGFVIAHDGEDAGWVLVCWWAAELLHHVVFRADLDTPDTLTVAADATLTACTWELAVIAFERDAWVTAQHDTAAYLTRRLSADV